MPLEGFVPAIGELSLNWGEAYLTLQPLFLLIFGIVIYAIFIIKFYHFMAKKDILELNLNQYNRAKHPSVEKLLGAIFYILEYIIILPICIIFWSGVLIMLIAFLTKSHTTSTMVLTTIALVGAIRAVAYYNEEFSTEVSKLLPLVLLGVFLIDTTTFSFTRPFEVLRELPSILNTLVYYFLFVMALELILRIVSTFRDALQEE